jgi:hypothetical protein
MESDDEAKEEKRQLWYIGEEWRRNGGVAFTDGMKIFRSSQSQAFTRRGIADQWL